MPSKIGQNNFEAILALKNEKTIEHTTDGEIAQILASIYVLIGLRANHIPTKEQGLFYIDFIRRNFNTRKPREISIAFELAVLGKLDIDDANPYDQFTMEYFSKIMNGYRKWFNEQAQNYKQPEPQQIEYKMTDQEKHDDIAEYLQRKNININFIPVYLYNWMEQLNYFKLSIEEKKEVFNRAAKLHQQQLRKEAEQSGNYKEINKFINQLEKGLTHLEQSEKENIRNLARKMVVFDYIKKYQYDQENGCQPQNNH